MKNITILFLCFFIFVGAPLSLHAQYTINYQKPSAAIENLIKLPTEPVMSISPDRTIILFSSYDRFLKRTNDEAGGIVNLAGIKFNTSSNLPADLPCFNSLSFKSATDDSTIYPVEGFPEDIQIADYKWSDDSQYLGVVLQEEKGATLWVVNMKDKKARKIYDGYLNFSLVDEELFEWVPNEHSIIFPAIPSRNKAQINTAKRKPVIFENEKNTVPHRTYQGLLKNENDEALFDYYATSQLKKVDLKGKVSSLGRPGVILSFEPSPDGNYIKVHYVQKPYSYSFTVHRFPSDIVILDKEGKEDKTVTIPAVVRPLGRDAAYNVPRDFTWRTNANATLTWVKAQDEGDPAVERKERDQLFSWSAPFDKEPRVLQSSSFRYDETFWINDTLAVLVEKWWATRTKNWLLFNPQTGLFLDTLAHFNSQSFSENPGKPVHTRNGGLKRVLFQDTSVYLIRKIITGNNEVVPVLEKKNLITKKNKRVWQSEAPYYEYLVAFGKENSENNLIIARQSKTSPINLVRINPGNQDQEVLTYNINNLEVLNNALVEKELIYMRKDSIPLQASLYYSKDSLLNKGTLNCLIFAYPLDYIDNSSAGEVYTNPYYFESSLTIQKLLALSGYAVLDYTSFPVVGDKETHPNDTYLEQIELNAKAAIEAARNTGIINTENVAIMGHSYGAFMVANLLTHTNLFKAGIAMSGAYNRSLTPFGFQREYRTYWEEQALYHKLSPFQNAHKLTHPILLFHGELDENPGTHYTQSEHYFAALKGLGKTARFVSLPGESHVYTLLDSYMHIIWETDIWLKKHFNESSPIKSTRLSGGR